MECTALHRGVVLTPYLASGCVMGGVCAVTGVSQHLASWGLRAGSFLKLRQASLDPEIPWAVRALQGLELRAVYLQRSAQASNLCAFAKAESRQFSVVLALQFCGVNFSQFLMVLKGGD